jgi:hypothetical protein
MDSWIVTALRILAVWMREHGKSSGMWKDLLYPHARKKIAGFRAE